MITIRNLKVKDENGVEKQVGFGYESIKVTDTSTLKDFLQKNPNGTYYPVDNSIMDEVENIEHSIDTISEDAIKELFSKN